MIFCHLFVYGILLDPKRREEVIGRKMPYSEPDTLSGFAVDDVVIEGEHYPALVPRVSSMVHGSIVMIHEEELRILDEYETDAYKRDIVTLMSGKEAWVFVKRDIEPKEVVVDSGRILYEVLRQISRAEGTSNAPDAEYLNSLSTIGLIENGSITDVGKTVLSGLWKKYNYW
jgi:gamma-glutamylcyclotransferase (GGCT)/AIG2-like uncharacterized protein YtfP